MKKLTKGSAFCMVKARNDKKKLERTVEETTKEDNKQVADTSNVVEPKTRDNDKRNKHDDPERESLSKGGTSLMKKQRKRGRSSKTSKKDPKREVKKRKKETAMIEEKRNTAREVIDVDAIEVIEIADDDCEHVMAKSTRSGGSRIDAIEIEDDDNRSGRSKKRKKKDKDVTQKKENVLSEDFMQVEEDAVISKADQLKKTDEGQNDQIMGRNEDASSCGRQTQLEEGLKLIDQSLPVIAEKDELCCLAVRDDVLLIMTHPCDLVIKGRARLQCLTGSVQIMGYDLDPSHSAINVFSPDSNSLLTMATTQCGTVTELDLVVESVKKEDEGQGNMLETVLKRKHSPIIVRVQRLRSQVGDLLANHHLFYNLFETNPDCEINTMLQRVGISVYGTGEENYCILRVGDGIQSVLSQWNSSVLQSKNEAYTEPRDQPVILVCGAKNSGKSTTNRLVINTTLNSLDCVYFLDCDVGQSEFTPPGCVSLVKVTEPVFGPPFTHQRTPECSYYFGGVSPSDDPNGYIDCVQKCVQYYKGLSQSTPLVVNSMGWIEDLGLQLLIDTIRLVEPAFLVQLQARYNDQLPDQLHTKSSWTDMSKTKISKITSSVGRTMKQMYIEAEIHKRESKYNWKELRTLTTLSHLCGSLEPGLSLYSVSPYRVRWKDVAIHICHKDVPRNQIMYALNASLVALCEADISQKTEQLDESGPKFFLQAPTFKWKGYGIIRGIDPIQKMLIVVTPMSVEELQTVNTIVKGSALLPDELLMDQDTEIVPYVDGRISSFGEKTLKPRRIPKVQKI